MKQGSVIAFQGVCIKIHHRQFFHLDRCLASWKMARALEVRSIPVPRSLAYFLIGSDSFFLSELLVDSTLLNDYLSSLTGERQKRQALKKLAIWLRNIHDHQIWQPDFKSSNVPCLDSDYFLVDLDSVKICRGLPDENKIINLAQLNASLSNAITIKDRLRFYCYYRAEERPTRGQRCAFYRKVWAITKTKNTSVLGLYIEGLRS